MSRAYVFPGQGAQAIGMGKALAEAYPQARAVFDEVDEALGEKLSAVIWDGDIETLTLTANAQPALMATSIAALRALEVEGFGIGQAAYVAGHSLGEYSALCAAGALGLAEALGCRRQALLGYFGEEAEACGNCDLCDTPPEVFDATTPVRMALSAALRTEERFGAGHLIEVLLGANTDKIRQHGHALADAREIVDRQSHAAAVGDGEKM